MNKTIAKNTIVLYSRSVINLLLGLLISRLTLEALGVSDYGIYTVVGSLVALLSLLNSSLNAAISRHITISVGKGDNKLLRETVSSILFLLLVCSIIVVLVAESAGLWMLYYHISIPDGRAHAAFVVFQLSVCMFIMGMVSVLYNSVLSAYEDFSTIATIEIIAVFIKFLFALSLTIVSSDKLVYLSVTTLVISVLSFLAYFFCCRRKYPCSAVCPRPNKDFLKKLIPFYSWNLFGSIAWVLKNSGISLLINIFFGVTVNAAQGIAMQVSSAVSILVGSFTAATQPQITKRYAKDDYSEMWKLIFNGTRFAICLLAVISMPLMFNMEFVMGVWLNTVPTDASLFAICLLLNVLLETFSVYIITALLATGKIACYQVSVGIVMLLNVPLTYIAYKNGCPPITYIYISIFITIIAFLMRIVILKRLLYFSLGAFFSRVVFKTISTILCSSALLCIVKVLFNGCFLGNVLSLILATIINTVVVFLLGFTREERISIINQCVSKIKKF